MKNRMKKNKKGRNQALLILCKMILWINKWSTCSSAPGYLPLRPAPPPRDPPPPPRPIPPPKEDGLLGREVGRLWLVVGREVGRLEEPPPKMPPEVGLEVGREWCAAGR